MAFLDPRPRLRKTASPYFRLNFLNSTKLPGGEVEDTQSFENAKRNKFKNGIPRSIASRLMEVRYTNERDKGDKVDLTFRSVSVADMDTIFFAKGVGYELYLGWWDWFTTVRNSARVFSGIVVSNSFGYDEMGANITLTLEHKGLAKAREPIPLDVLTKSGTVKSVKDSLREMAKYLGVRLAWAVTEPDTKAYLEGNLVSDREAPHVLSLFSFKVDSKGNLVKKRMTASDFLSKLAKTYGQVWYIHANVLYFGTAKNTPRATVRKIFRYREQGGIKDLLNPVDEDTFKSLTPVKLRNTGIKSKILVIDDKTKEMEYVEAKAEDVNSVPDRVFIYDEGVSPTSVEKAPILNKLRSLKTVRDRRAKLQAENRVVTEATKQSDVDPGRPMSVTANSKADAKAQIKGRTEKAKETMMALLVSGAKGDPFFGVWDLYQVSGASNLQGHNGVYTTVKAVHTINRDEGYSMDLTGTKPQPLRTKEFNKLQDDLVKGADERKASNRKIMVYKEKGATEVLLTKDKLSTKNGYRDGPQAER